MPVTGRAAGRVSTWGPAGADPEERLARLRHEAALAAGLVGPRTADVMVRAGEWLPDAVAEAEEARSLLDLLRVEYARLAAAARASVAAASAGQADPLVYVRAELARHGGLPPKDASILAVLADATGAMRVAGRAGQLPDYAGKAAS
jgi:hypothetical protein